MRIINEVQVRIELRTTDSPSRTTLRRDRICTIAPDLRRARSTSDAYPVRSTRFRNRPHALASLMADHDLSYKHLFSHFEMVRDLLEGFVRPDWVAQLDLRSLNQENASYVSDTLRARHGDMAWSFPLSEGRTPLHVLLEFQSRVDPEMPVRMLTYAGLRYQQLLKSGSVSSEGPLPPVLPIVLYNGRPRWYAAETTGAMIEPVPAGLEAYQPRMRYLLIDVARYPNDELARMRNIVAAVFRLENSNSWPEAKDVIAELKASLRNPERATLRRAFSKWLNEVIIPRYSREQPKPVNDFEETSVSLAEAVERWKLDFRLEGHLNGERQILTRLLRKRFGELPPRVTQHLQQAQTEELERWAERLLDARNLAELFDDNAVEA